MRERHLVRSGAWLTLCGMVRLAVRTGPAGLGRPTDCPDCRRAYRVAHLQARARSLRALAATSESPTWGRRLLAQAAALERLSC